MILQRGIEAIRREAMAKTQQKLKEQKHFQSKVDALSKHNVGSIYDVRAIAKSRQFKEQDNHYSTEMAMTELPQRENNVAVMDGMVEEPEQTIPDEGQSIEGFMTRKEV